METDLRRICTSLGLNSKPVFDWLYTLHNSLKESLPRGDKPTIQNLLEVCRVAKKQLDLGFSLQKSFYIACYSVLVQTQKNTLSKEVWDISRFYYCTDKSCYNDRICPLRFCH